MRGLRIAAIALAAYVGIVVAFESLIGVFQPESGAVLVITTFEGAVPHDRGVSRLDSDGKLYVAANHWPRAGTTGRWRIRTCRSPWTARRQTILLFRLPGKSMIGC